MVQVLSVAVHQKLFQTNSYKYCLFWIFVSFVINSFELLWDLKLNCDLIKTVKIKPHINQAM